MAAHIAFVEHLHAELEELVIAAERRLGGAREQLRSLEREAQEAQFQARALAARRGELQRSIETADQQIRANEGSIETLADELARLDDAAAQDGLQEALALRIELLLPVASVTMSVTVLGPTWEQEKLV